MKPVNFPESNKTLVKPESTTDEQCGNLPVFNDGQISVSCWQMSFTERLKMLLTGKIWLMVWFGPSQPPACLTASKPIKTEKRSDKR